MAEQNNTSATTSAQSTSPKGGLSAESEFHAKFFPILARVASVTAVLMYVFYFPQIIGNLSGHKGDWIQPLVAAVNCTLWVLYGLWRPKKDVPIIIANAPGIVFGGLAAITALI
ncbi:SemiSWEET family transporter [Rothia mucilaginosa]|uniref:SemiSWEET family transporter n=1 Tax=Rothia mucilaginosa TaxID=43675 RepID=UPI0028F0109F|nr:SemiSWEET family transporter [Rothia mucilaginosa]